MSCLKINTGGAAFPEPATSEFTSGEPGMTMREYYAAHAPITLEDAARSLGDVGRRNSNDETLCARLANMRAMYADAMVVKLSPGEV